MRSCIAALTLAALLAAAGPARAEDDALYALVLGVNRSADRELPELRYADDDAARFFDLFRLLGARTSLLATLDANTRRLHPQAAAEAQPPRQVALQTAARALGAELRQARQRGLRTTLYLVYAGHGSEERGQGHLGLEDGQLTREGLRALIAGLGADRTHLIIDACKSDFLAQGRGPGGWRRPVRGFSAAAGLGDGVGLLLSSSPSRETHEWEAFQAGVFSHAVRSGLYGAADADGDGRVSYREIAAFVERAGEAIPNERFRASVYARAPRGSDLLVELRRGLRRGVRIEPARHGRYLLEDARGVRLADLHSGPGQEVRLLRPGAGVLYLRRLSDDREVALAPSASELSVASLEPQPSRTATRGAAHHAFSLLFSLPFDRSVVAAYRLPPETVLADDAAPRPRIRARRLAAWSVLGLGAASLLSGIALTASAIHLRDGVTPGESQVDRIARNDGIDRRNTAAVTLYAVAGAAAVTSALLFLWPERTHAPAATVGREGLLVGYGGSF